MKNKVCDQADGLRRLMAASAAKPVAVAVVECQPGAPGSSVTRNLAAALLRQGQRVLLLDEYSGQEAMAEQRDERLILIHAVLDKDGALSNLAASADHVLVVFDANAAAIKQAYLCIKRLHFAHAMQRMRVLVNGVADAAEAQRILTNLATTGSRYLAVALEPAGWVRADPLMVQAERLNLSVVEGFPASPSATDFRRVAADSLRWTGLPAASRAPSPLPGLLARSDAAASLSMC
ncbi:MAG: flagellar biosynthesis protein FlhG [Polaromonas sp.]